MANDTNKSGYETGCEYAERLKEYLDTTEELPCSNGKANKTAIARAAGIPRKSLYKNPACEELIEAALGKKRLAGRQQDDIRVKLERRIISLEHANASLVAEVHELRRKLVQFQHIESVLEEGRRVIL